MKSAPKLSATVETVTPEMASRMLGTMEHNRRMRRSTVERYAREMATGRWQLNGEPIIVGHDGRLRDGQHRLNAVVMAKIPIAMLIVRGVQPEAMASIDTGASRSYGDVVTLRGGSSLGPQMASIARLWWLYENTEYLNSKVGLSHQELDAIIAGHPTTEEAAFRANRSTFKRHFPTSVLGFVFSFLCEREDPEIAELFISTVEKGAQLAEDDPIFALRRRLIESERRDSRSILALVIKAYNEWIDGQKIQTLVWRSGERFPRFGKPSKDARRARRPRAEPTTT
ncbi:MAG: hypothetical protein ACREBE_29825 [bacterium]